MIKLLIYSRIIVYLLSSAQSSGGDPNSAMCTKGTKLIMKGNNNDKKKKGNHRRGLLSIPATQGGNNETDRSVPAAGPEAKAKVTAGTTPSCSCACRPRATEHSQHAGAGLEVLGSRGELTSRAVLRTCGGRPSCLWLGSAKPRPLSVGCQGLISTLESSETRPSSEE